jgi:hypothetical protein
MQAQARAIDHGWRPWLACALGLAAVVLGSRAVVATAAFRARPDLLAAAVASDLTLTAAAIAWATLVRTRRVSPLSLVAVVSAGLWVATALLSWRSAPHLGLRRRGDSLGLRVDDPGALRRALIERRPELAPPPRGRPGSPARAP